MIKLTIKYKGRGIIKTNYKVLGKFNFLNGLALPCVRTVQKYYSVPEYEKYKVIIYVRSTACAGKSFLL
jgi:hypothetical protein